MKIRNLNINENQFSGFAKVGETEFPIRGTFTRIESSGGIYDKGDLVIDSVYFRPEPGRPEVRVDWVFECGYTLSHWESQDDSQWGVMAERLLHEAGVLPYI